MSQHESWHWTYEPVERKLHGMTATQIRPATQLSPLVAGIRTAVERHADWAETAQLVADQLRRHLPTPDVLTAEQRLGSPDDYRGHTCTSSPTARSRSSLWSGGPASSRASTTTSRGACSASSRASSTRSCSTPTSTWSASSDNHVGDVSGFAPPGDIHRVHNTADETAISIHVYGTDVTRIGSSARRYYD